MIFDSFKEHILGQKQNSIDSSQATANEFIGVKDIRGSILYTRTNDIFAYVKVQSVSMSLLSDTEKRVFVQSLTTELSSETKPFRLIAIPRPVDISIVLDEYIDIYNNCTTPSQKELLKKDIAQLADFATSREVIERQYYIVLWESMRDDAERDLFKRAHEWVQKLGSCGVNAEVLTQENIILLCNLFANPSYAHLEDTEYETSMPLLSGLGMELEG